MSDWCKFSTTDITGDHHYATRRDRGLLTLDETRAGLEQTVEARTAVELERRIAEQEWLDAAFRARQYQEGKTP